MDWHSSKRQNPAILCSQYCRQPYCRQRRKGILPRNTCVRFTMPTGMTWYLSTLSSKRRWRSRAVHWLSLSLDSPSGIVKGSLLPLFRLLPVRRGTVTVRRTLLDGELMDCNGLDMASSGRKTRLAGVSAFGGFRIYFVISFLLKVFLFL